MSRRGAGVLGVVLALAAMVAALALPAGHEPIAATTAAVAPVDAAPAVEVELYSGYTPYGQRVLIGTVPAVADRLELTNAGVTTTVGLTDQGTLDGLRRHIQLPLPGIGPWQATALWAEHRLGSDDGPPENLPRDHSV